MNIRAISFAIIVIISLNGCLPISNLPSPEWQLRQALEKCEFTLESIKPDINIEPPKLTLEGITKPKVDILFHLLVGIKNNSSLKLATTKLDFVLFADSKPMTKTPNDPLSIASINKSKSVSPAESITIPIDVKVPAEKAATDIARILKSGNVFYRVEGTFYFSFLGIELPIDVMLLEGKEIFK